MGDRVTPEMVAAFHEAFNAPAPAYPAEPTNSLDRMDALARRVIEAVLSAAPSSGEGEPVFEDCAELNIRSPTVTKSLSVEEAARIIRSHVKINYNSEIALGNGTSVAVPGLGGLKGIDDAAQAILAVMGRA